MLFLYTSVIRRLGISLIKNPRLPEWCNLPSMLFCHCGLQQPLNMKYFSAAYFSISTSVRGDSTATSDGIWKKLKFKLGLDSGLKFPKSVLDLSGFRMYICCTELIDCKEFFQVLNLPDTYNSWFLVTNLHLWLCMVRLALLGNDGCAVRSGLIRAFWKDMELRSKLLSDKVTLAERKEATQVLHSAFNASLFCYDEGLLGNDKEMAAALWRTLFEKSDSVEPWQLELMVHYVRKQVAHLDNQIEAIILGKGYVTFLPLQGETISVNNAHLHILGLSKKV